MSNITNNSSSDMFEVMEKAYKFAEIMAKSDIIPEHYRSKPANVFIAVQTAYRMKLDPMLVMQNTFVVSGKLGMNTSFALSLANNSGLFESGIRYREEGAGADMKVTAFTNLKKTGEEISYTFTLKQAQAEGYTRNSKYRTMPELMLRYRAATLLIRTHAPEVMNGMHMVEELEDVQGGLKEVNPNGNSLTEKLSSALNKYKTPANDRPKALDKTPEGSDKTNGSDSNADDKPEDPVSYRLAQLEILFRLIPAHNIPQETVDKWCERASVNSIDELNIEHIEKCINFIEEKYGRENS